jgi:type IV secretion system protein VirD4
MTDVFRGMSRGVPGKGPREMAPVTTEFADDADIEEAAWHELSIFLGIYGATIQKDEFGERYAQGGLEVGVHDDRHLLTIAGSRAGKGRAAIIPNMLRYPGSVLAIDPKGELARATAKNRAERLGQRVAILDPFGTTGDALASFKTGFNPVAMMRAESLVEDAVLITDALVIPGSGDPHWDESARTISRA